MTTTDLDRALDIYAMIASPYENGDESMAYVVIPGPPASKARPRFTRTGRAYSAPGEREAEAHTRSYLERMVDEPWTGNVALGCVFFRPNYQRIDVDNMLKHVNDAANEVLWRDDSQVTALMGLVEYDAENPRTLVMLAPHRSTLARGSDHSRECLICGKPFSLIGINPKKRTCSKECAVRLRGYVPLNEEVPCAQCGAPFVRQTTAQTMCSSACRSASLAGRNRGRATDRPFSVCVDCGTQLTHRRGGRCRDCWRLSIQLREVGK